MLDGVTGFMFRYFMYKMRLNWPDKDCSNDLFYCSAQHFSHISQKRFVRINFHIFTALHWMHWNYFSWSEVGGL